MQKKIDASELRLGMYVSRLVASWLDHPFWKKSFLLTDPKQLAQIRAAGIREVFIDTSRGLEVETGPDATPADDDALATMIATGFLSETATATGDPRGTGPAGPCSFADELERAGRIVASGRAAMHDMFRDARLGRAVDAEHCLPLVAEITQSIDRNPGAIVSLARLKTSDDYTYMHSVAVCALMIALARQLGMSTDATRDAGVAGLVHDIGKVRMPHEILNKAGGLTDAEYTVMRSHPEVGHEMLREMTGIGAGALDVCLHHHERVDGRGYPFGLSGERLSMLARMGAICDVYDAITSNRPYKAGWDPSMSIQKMAQWSRDGHFDERVLQAFIRSIGIYPVGSLVRLASGRIAVVVDQTPDNLLVPIVVAILRVATRTRCVPERIDLSHVGMDDRIVSREKAQDWDLVAVDDHWRLPDGANVG